jgi:hypothetical protein
MNPLYNAIKLRSLGKAPMSRGFTRAQAQMIDDQITNSVANKGSLNATKYMYSKPFGMLGAPLGLAAGFGALNKSGLVDDAMYGKMFGLGTAGKGGLFQEAARQINPLGMEYLDSLGLASGGFMSNWGLGGLYAAKLPGVALLSSPGYALAGALKGAGGTLGALGAGMAASPLTGAVGTMASLYALKKGGELAARGLKAYNRNRRIQQLMQGKAPTSINPFRRYASGYTDEHLKYLGLDR